MAEPRLFWNERGDHVDKNGTVFHRAHPQCTRDARCYDAQDKGKHDWYFKTLSW